MLGARSSRAWSADGLPTAGRHESERSLRSADDLIRQIDDVAVALEALAAAAAEMRQLVLRDGADAKTVGPKALATQDAYQVARTAIARLGMRPQATESLVTKASDAADEFLEAWKLVHAALMTPGSHVDLPQVMETVERGYENQRAYQAVGRQRIKALLGAPAGS